MASFTPMRAPDSLRSDRRTLLKTSDETTPLGVVCGDASEALMCI